jgi:hypothetical protein
MTKGFKAYRIQGTCLGEVDSGSYFNEATAHIVCGTPVQYPMYSVMSNGCPYNPTRSIVANPPYYLVGGKMWKYGHTPNINAGFSEVIELPSVMNFDAAELLGAVGPYVIRPSPLIPRYVYVLKGWRWKYPSVTLPLARKFSNRTPTFKNFTKVDWTNFYPIDNDQPDIGEDWLGNVFNDGDGASYPVMHSMGVNQPFLGETYYEDTESTIDKSKKDYLYNFVPFCNNINIYDNNGKPIGYADGLGFQLFVFNGALKNRLRPVLKPLEDPETVRKLLATNLQYWSVELWTYLSVVKTSTDPTVVLKSPRLHTNRWWYYTQPYGKGISPGLPYIFWRADCDVNRLIRFNLLQNKNNPTNESSVVYETPWEYCKLYMTA